MNGAPGLSRWQETQAAMLHHFASLEYLTAFAQLVRDLGNGGVDLHGVPCAPPAAEAPAASTVANPVAIRTSRGGSNRHGRASRTRPRPAVRGYNGIFMGPLQKSLDEVIALRRRGIYGNTYVSSILRHAHETEMQYASPEGWAEFETVSALLSSRSEPIDQLIGAHGRDFDDFTFACYLSQFAAQCPVMPRFRVRTDIVCACGDIPSRTGVYLPADDPHASLRFAWSGPEAKPLAEATTFNLLGKAALAAVGRDAMWFDTQAMHAFTRKAFAARALALDACWDLDAHPDLVPSLVARHAFVPVASRWYLVEPLDGTD